MNDSEKPVLIVAKTTAKGLAALFERLTGKPVSEETMQALLDAERRKQQP